MIKLTENQREILQALLDGREIESYHVGDKEWYIVRTYDFAIFHLYQGHKLRIKPRTIIVNGVEVPEPMKVKPANGQKFYLASPTPDYRYWKDCMYDEISFDAGICHSTPEAAILHWEAMIKPSKIVRE